MSTDTASARELTRRLVARAAAQSESSNGAVPPIYAASERVCLDLSRSLGAAGFNALLARALEQAQKRHPLLEQIRIGHTPDPILGGLAATAKSHGDGAVAAGLEATLETLFVLLGRLIGDDMVPRLVEQGAHVGSHDEEEGNEVSRK